MTQAMDALDIGDSLLFKGPKGRFQFTAGSTSAYGLLAGGTGITPMYQLIHAVLKDPNDTTTLSLIFANVTEDDILLKEELDELAARNPARFNVYYVLNEAAAGWTGGRGFITADMIKEHLPAPVAGVVVARCGPAPMMKAMEAHLTAIGFSTEQQFQF